MRRSITILSFCLLLVSIGAMPLRAAEGSNTPDPAAEQDFFSRINAERTSRGLAALGWHAQAASVARAHSEDMADDGRIYHNGSLASQMSNWAALGENVGVGPTVGAIHGAFMNSSAHRDNILGSFTHVGIGVVERDGSLYVTEVFVTPASSGGSGGGSSGSGGSGSGGSGGSGSGGSSGGGSSGGGSSGGSRPSRERPTSGPSAQPSERMVSRVRAATAAPIKPVAETGPDGVAERTIVALARLTDQDPLPSRPEPCLSRRPWC